MAEDLVRRGVAVIVALAPAAAVAAKKAATSIPIVFVIGNDPVSLGLVTSLNHPSGNATGVTFLVNALAGKRLQLISDIVPNARAFALLVIRPPLAPISTARTLPKSPQKWAGHCSLQMSRMTMNWITHLRLWPSKKLTASSSVLTHCSRALATDLLRWQHSTRFRTIYHLSEAVAAGGLMSYGTSFKSAHHLAGRQILCRRILKGEKSDELPVQQSTKFEFAINVATAKALELTVPPSLLSLADEVIE